MEVIANNLASGNSASIKFEVTVYDKCRDPSVTFRAVTYPDGLAY